MRFDVIRSATHRNANRSRDLADSGVTQVAQPLSRLRKIYLPHHGDVFGADTRLFQPGLTRRQIHISRNILVCGGGQRCDENSVSFFVPVSLINRDDDHWAFAFFGRISGELYKPNLATQRRSLAAVHNLFFGRDLLLRKLSPQPILLSLLGGQGVVVAGNSGIHLLVLALLLPLADDLLQDRRRGGTASLLPRSFQIANGLPGKRERLALFSSRCGAWHASLCTPRCALRCMTMYHIIGAMPRAFFPAQEPYDR